MPAFGQKSSNNVNIDFIIPSPPFICILNCINIFILYYINVQIILTWKSRYANYALNIVKRKDISPTKFNMFET